MISIVIVHYNSLKEIQSCISSIYKHRILYDFEVIVVDNGGGEGLERMEKKYANFHYYKSKENKGFGAGNNIGVNSARGEYIFILNPDTVYLPGSIEELVRYIEKDPQIGIVAPLLLNKDALPHRVQGTMKLGIKEGIFSLSFLNKYFPHNIISRHYLMLDWDKKEPIEVDVVPGAAFLMRKDLYQSIGGFDERFFLYFEEVDLCRRVKEKGLKLIVVPTAKIVHIGGQSTKHLASTSTFFEQSRRYYYTKYYGSLTAHLLELFLTRVRRRVCKRKLTRSHGEIRKNK